MRLSRIGLAAAGLLLTAINPASACNRGKAECSVLLFNNTSHRVESFWASPSRIDKWENDIFGDKVLLPGREVNVDLSDGRPDCIYDFKFRFSDDDELIRKGINICRLGKYTLDE